MSGMSNAHWLALLLQLSFSESSQYCMERARCVTNASNPNPKSNTTA
jgi:hypothetical protein